VCGELLTATAAAGPPGGRRREAFDCGLRIADCGFRRIRLARPLPAERCDPHANVPPSIGVPPGPSPSPPELLICQQSRRSTPRICAILPLAFDRGQRPLMNANAVPMLQSARVASFA
jgi:hypothetical protein